MTAADWLARARAALTPVAGPDLAAREARLILARATGWSAATCAVAGADPLPPGADAALDAMLARRQTHEPLAQILGEAPFYGRSFEVSSDVLTPRPDTETLIDIALATPFMRVLDLGTGSGAIAVTLLAERPEASATATDISEPALGIAARNAARHGVCERLTLQRADWWTSVTGAFDLIVSNPPYVTAEAYAALSPEITRFEPEAALTPGEDGLSAFRAILGGLAGRLTPGGRLVLEIGHDQGRAVAALCRDARLEKIRLTPDINGKDRIVTGVAPAATKP